MNSFKQYFNENKHVGENSCFCGYCKANLKVSDIVIGKHMYPIGQLLLCGCKKSRIFTNTIRKVDNLIDYCEGNRKVYTNGFCNDKKCGYCFGYLNPITNGIDVPDMNFRADKYGCSKNCRDNQELLIVGKLNLPEKDSTVNYFIEFYMKHLNKVKELYKTVNSLFAGR
jgi:hypothetical protein